MIKQKLISQSIAEKEDIESQKIDELYVYSNDSSCD